MYTKYRDANRQWRWRYETNFRVIAVSSEAYVNESDCDRSIAIMTNSGNAPVNRE